MKFTIGSGFNTVKLCIFSRPGKENPDIRDEQHELIIVSRKEKIRMKSRKGWAVLKGVRKALKDKIARYIFVSDTDISIFLWNILYGYSKSSGKVEDNWKIYNTNYPWWLSRLIIYNNDIG